MSLVVVSDGAGSARLSQYGSATVTRTLGDLLPGMEVPQGAEEERECASHIVATCRAALELTAAELGCDLRDLAATVSFVVVRGQQIVAGCLGDGIVGAVAGGAAEVLLGPARGEFANETVFLTSSRATEHLRLRVLELAERDGFIAMTDGAAESLYERRTGKLAPAVSRVLAWYEGNHPDSVEKALEDSVLPLLLSKTSDDCSVALLKRVSRDVPGLADESPEFQMAMLGVRSTRGLRNRQAVLAAHLAEAERPPEHLAGMVKLTPRTVGRHLRELAALLIR